MGDFADTLAHVMQLHARYCDAVWRKDVQAFGECFTEEAEWRISGMVVRGRTDAMAMIDTILGRAKRVYIEFQTPILDISGGALSARTYMNERCAWLDGKTNVAIGRYYEHFVREGDRLRFAWRLWQGLYTGPPDLTGDYGDFPDYGAPPGMPPRAEVPPDTASAKWGLTPPDP